MIRWSIRSGGSCAAPFRLRISASIIRSKSSRALLNPRVAGSGRCQSSSPPGSRKRWNTRIPASSTSRISDASDSTSALKIVLPDDVECEVGHRHVDVELHAASPASRRALRGRHHLGAVRLDHGPAEHRLDHPPPAQVVGALAGQQPVTEQAPRRPQRAALHERRMLVDKDTADQVRIADEMEAMTARKRHVRDRPACPGNILQIRQRVAQIGGGVAPTGRRAATNALRLGYHSHASSLRPARSLRAF